MRESDGSPTSSITLERQFSKVGQFNGLPYLNQMKAMWPTINALLTGWDTPSLRLSVACCLLWVHLVPFHVDLLVVQTPLCLHGPSYLQGF